ncbi:MAG: glutathione peroxidase [Planctomycetota bacterium]|nr:glutathione peroxidase [Planctomycetota bacterium]
MSMYRKTLMAGIAAMAIVSGYGDKQLSPFSSAQAADAPKAEVPKVFSFKAKTLEGEAADLSKYAGKVVVFVNVASKCGATPQYAALEKLYESHKEKGLIVVGVPSNQFGGQEPGTSKEIREFCKSKYHVTFDLLEKANVKDTGSEKACELFAYLSAQDAKPAGKGPVAWNFEKFIVDRKGNVVGRFKTGVEPDSKEMIAVIEKALAE